MFKALGTLGVIAKDVLGDALSGAQKALIGPPIPLAPQPISSEPAKIVLLTAPTTALTVSEYAPAPEPLKIPPLAREANTYSTEFNQSPANVTKSAHEVDAYFRVIDGIKRPSKVEYVKTFEISKNSPGNQFAPEAEAAAYELYKYLAPDNTASTHAIYSINENAINVDSQLQFMGVASKELIEAKALRDKPLTMEDLENPLLIKDLARIFTASHCAGEDDLHDGNIVWHKKDGVWRLSRIDYDMSRWPIYHEFKNFTNPNTFFGYVWSTGTEKLNQSVRTLNINNYEPKEEDIRNSPVFSTNNSINNAHYHWVGRGRSKTILTSNSSASKKASSSSANSKHTLDAASINLYEALGKHPVYIKEKYTVYLAYILSNPYFHDQNNRLHFRSHATYKNENILEKLKKYEANRIQQFRKVLMNMPEFQAFLKNDGNDAIETIKAEMKTRETRIICKKEKNNKTLNELNQDLQTAIERNKPDEIIRIKAAIQRRENKKTLYENMLKNNLIAVSEFDNAYQLLTNDIENLNKPILPLPEEDADISPPDTRHSIDIIPTKDAKTILNEREQPKLKRNLSTSNLFSNSLVVKGYGTFKNGTTPRSN
jgi:hypothetical protein